MRHSGRALMAAAILWIVTPSDAAAAAVQPQRFTVTAYCQHGLTKSGVPATRGVAAADPAYLPLGSVIHVEAPRRSDRGVYTVLDTGAKVSGRHIDLYQPNCSRAKRFGRQLLRVTVLRLGWRRLSPTFAARIGRNASR